jgi:glucuronate isomerase
MDKTFIHKNFLLETDAARQLYHNYAKEMPLIDYHCHLSPKEIAENKKFDNLTQIWLAGDHYKWRAMRANGVDESFITGNKPDKEKFLKWAETVPYTLRNPLFHWTHLELKRYFEIDELLNGGSAERIYNTCNEKLQTEEFKVQNLIRKANVEIICTTDDPVDSLEYHQQLHESDFEVKVIPAWRPDKAMAVEDTTVYNNYLNKLEAISGNNITSFLDLLDALQKRHDYFAANGCKLSDHGIEDFYVEKYTLKEIEKIFQKVRKGEDLQYPEVLKFKSAMLIEFAKMDFEKGWVQQFHYGVLRNNNSRMFQKLGPDSGFDSIGDFSVAKSINRFFDNLDSIGKLTKTIIYNINPRDNDMIATMIGNFQDGTTPGKMQFGSGWWFLDQKQGMEAQMNALSNHGLLSRFVGMLTDSRSFLSYPRHEYFRRVLCNLLGNDIEKGLIPNDIELVGEMVQSISYFNSKNYFNF